MASPTAILKGTLYLRKVGDTQLLSTGNATTITLSHEIDEKTIPNMQNPGGGNHDSFKRPKAVKLAVSFRNMSKQVLEIAFGAKVTAVAGGAIVAEAHNDIVLGSLIKTAKPSDLAIAMVVEKGATTYVEGTDYQRVRAGIIPLATGTMVAGDDITIDYTAVASHRVDGLMYTSSEFYGLFDGANERKGSPAVGNFWRLVFGPASKIELVGDDFVSFDCEAENLADDTRPATESPFYFFEIGGIS
jgi:hypothetical protein